MTTQATVEAPKCDGGQPLPPVSLLARRTTRSLVSRYLWGEEPQDREAIVAELKSRGVDIMPAHDEMEALIDKYASANNQDSRQRGARDEA